MRSILRKLIKLTTIIIFIILIIISIAGGILIYNTSNAFFALKQGYTPTRIYDCYDNLISTDNLYYTYASITDISKNIQNAFVAIEDRDFYKHHGFNTKRIIKAISKNITSGSTMGASTITQQYVKNVYLTNEKTLKRKINEIAIAIEIEKRYTKDQIMEAYLNSILFGSNIYGIEMASNYYFGKKSSEVTISMAAYLAGMIQAPNYYNAYKNPDEATKRKNVVLSCMLQEGYISLEEYNIEKNINMSDLLKKDKASSNNSYYSSYLDYIGETTSKIDEIHTYMNPEIQHELYNIITNKYGLFNDDELNCGIIVLDNQSYGILGIAGNRNSDRLLLNYATTVKHQPGSTIKPILDYAPAIEYLNYGPATIIKDEEYSYQNGTAIHNYDHRYLGDITLRRALSDSRNIPAVKLFNEVGMEKAFDFAKRIGITSSNHYEADSIGGATEGYTLLNLANAYQAFANLGYYKKASAIKYYKNQQQITQNLEKEKLVMKPQTAFLINSILHDVYRYSSYDMKNTYLMAKTGQTNYDEQTRKKYNIPANATKDSLLIAYTKDLTIGIWIGYPQIKAGHYIDGYKKTIPRSIMKILMTKFAKDNMFYDEIDGIIKKHIIIADGKAYLSTDLGFDEYFISGTEPLSYYDDRKRI